MTDTLDHARKLLSDMTPAEKAQLLQWIAQDLGNAFPGIERRPGVQGGAACIIRTRIPVWTLVQFRELGATDAKLLQSYPTLTAQDLANAWTYYDAHRAEVDQEIAENEAV
jgi:uncharacterized protein (DUF433 family)